MIQKNVRFSFSFKIVMNIHIDKKNAIDGVHRQTALLALKNENGEVIAYSEDDEIRVEPLWLATLDELLQLLLPYARMSVTDVAADFLLSLPANWDDTQDESLQQLAMNYVTTAFTARWLDNIKPDSAMLLRSLNSSTGNAINELMLARKMPVRGSNKNRVKNNLSFTRFSILGSTICRTTRK